MSPPSEFYNIQIIDGSKVNCLICGCFVGRLDSKIDSIVLDIEMIRLVRIEPRNLTAICTSKDADHSHELLVSSAYCDTVYKSYAKPEFYSVSRYQTLKQPCTLLPDKILGFDFIPSISHSFRYIRLHRFRHPSSLRGIHNPLSVANLQTITVPAASDNILSDSLTAIPAASTPSSSSNGTVRVAKETIPPPEIMAQSELLVMQPTHNEIAFQSTTHKYEHHFQWVFNKILLIQKWI